MSSVRSPVPATAVVPGKRKFRSPEPPAWIGWAFVAPNLIGFGIFTLLPLTFSLAIAFAEWDVISGVDNIRWVGVQNFTRMMDDAAFWSAAGKTLFLSLIHI